MAVDRHGEMDERAGEAGQQVLEAESLLQGLLGPPPFLDDAGQTEERDGE